jgi:AsmA family protein
VARLFRSALATLLALLGLAAGLLVGSLAVLELGGWNLLRGPITGLVEARTGRSFAISGLDVDLGLTPRVHARGVRLGNAHWVEGDAPLFATETLALDIRLVDLLRGRVTLPYVALERPRANLVRRADGRANWTLGTGGAGGEPPRIGTLVVREGELRLDDAPRGIVLHADVHAAEGERADVAGRLRLAAQGRYNGGEFRLDAEAGSLEAYRGAAVRYPLTFDVGAAGTRLRFKGTLGPGGSLDAVAGALALRGHDLAALYPLTGVVLPNSPPYALRTRLTRAGDTVRLASLEGFIGDSDAAGTLEITLREPRPHLRADLRSRTLDLDDLAALFGGAPATQGAETASPAQKAQAQLYAREQRLLPDARLDPERLRAMDASVRYHAQQVQARGAPLRDLHIDVRLEDGLLRVSPVRLTLPQGELDLHLTLDGREMPAATRLELGVREVRLEDLAPRVGDAPALAGHLYGRAALEGRGNSVHEFATAADGRIGLAMNGGRMSHLVVELLGLDVAEALGVAVSEDETVRVRCMAGALDVRDGIAHPRTFVVDTTDSIISAQGRVNLGRERLDLELRARSKDPSLLAGQTPVTVSGPLRKPEIGVATGALAARGAAAAALGAVLSPLGALLAFVDPGLAEDSDCAALLREATVQGATAAQPDGRASPASQPR